MYKGGKRVEIDGSKLKRETGCRLFTDRQIIYMRDLLDAGYTHPDIAEHTESDPSNLRKSIIRGWKRIRKSVISSSELECEKEGGPWFCQYNYGG